PAIHPLSLHDALPILKTAPKSEPKQLGRTGLQGQGVEAQTAVAHQRKRPRGGVDRVQVVVQRVVAVEGARRGVEGQAKDELVALDRKSTRLNPSHSQI